MGAQPWLLFPGPMGSGDVQRPPPKKWELATSLFFITVINGEGGKFRRINARHEEGTPSLGKFIMNFWEKTAQVFGGRSDDDCL